MNYGGKISKIFLEKRVSGQIIYYMVMMVVQLSLKYCFHLWLSSLLGKLPHASKLDGIKPVFEFQLKIMATCYCVGLLA